MTVGGEVLLEKYGGVLGVAKAYILGQIDKFEEHVRVVCSSIDIQAAESAIRLERESKI